MYIRQVGPLRPDTSALKNLCRDCHCDTLGSDTVMLDDFAVDDMEIDVDGNWMIAVGFQMSSPWKIPGAN